MYCPSFLCNSTQKYGYRFIVVSTALRSASGSIRSRIRILIRIVFGFSLFVAYKWRSSVNSFCSIYSHVFPFLVIRPFFKLEQHRIDAEVHKGDDGIPRAPHNHRGSATVGQKFFGEWHLKQSVQCEIDRQSPKHTGNHPNGLARILKAYTTIVQKCAAHKAD